jgi:hypothetical protein
LVFVLTLETAELIATFNDEEALLMLLPRLVDAVEIAPLITLPRLVDAVVILPPTTEARDEEAELIFVFILEVAEFTRLASELEAEST